MMIPRAHACASADVVLCRTAEALVRWRDANPGRQFAHTIVRESPCNQLAKAADAPIAALYC